MAKTPQWSDDASARVKHHVEQYEADLRQQAASVATSLDDAKAPVVAGRDVDWADHLIRGGRVRRRGILLPASSGLLVIAGTIGLTLGTESALSTTPRLAPAELIGGVVIVIIGVLLQTKHLVQ